MKRNLSILVLMLAFLSTSFLVPVFADEKQEDRSTSVVVLVDFSGSITEDPRYPEAEKKALENLVNVDWPLDSKIAILAFGASDSRNGGLPSTFPMCPDGANILRSVQNIENWIDQCTSIIGTNPVGPNTDHNKAIGRALELLTGTDNSSSSKFVLLMTDGKLDVDNFNPVNPDYSGSSEERDEQAIEELFTEVLPLARENGIQIWPVGFGDVNRIELNGYAPEGGQPGPDSCQREIPRAVIAEPEDLPYEINKIIRQVTCLGEYLQGENVEIVLPDFADEATINVKHQEGETFKIQGPNGEEIEGGGKGTESTVQIDNPEGGNWQIISDNPVTAGYWWESSFKPQISCPEDSNIVEISIVPSNNDSTSTALSPLFNLDLIIDGKKETTQLELGEVTTVQIEEDSVDILADASVLTIDQPGILSFESIQTDCANLLTVEITEPEIIIESEVEEEAVFLDCELTPDLEECKEAFQIPWWLIILLLATLSYLLWLYLKSRKLREGTFVIYDSNGEQGRVRVRKNTKSLSFNIDQNAELGSKVVKSNPEEYGTYEINKGRRGVDFIIDGPTGSGLATQRQLSSGDEIELEDGYRLTFEDGKNRKPIIVDTDNPFEDNQTNFFDSEDKPSDEEVGDNPFE